MKKIFVVDIETDNLDHRMGSVLEIGIVSLDFDSGEIKPIFNEVIYENKKINPEAWIFEHSNLKISDVYSASKLDNYCIRLQRLFLEGFFTAFNQKFDFGWLKSRYFVIDLIWLDPMIILTPIMKLHHHYYGCKYPTVEEAYYYLFGENIVEEHRALPDAIVEAKMILKMYQEEYFFDKIEVK